MESVTSSAQLTSSRFCAFLFQLGISREDDGRDDHVALADGTDHFLVEVEHLQLDVNIRLRRLHLETGKMLVRCSHDVSAKRQQNCSIWMHSCSVFDAFRTGR